jgi:RNA polymerase sigma factor (TIGR02999 family)
VRGSTGTEVTRLLVAWRKGDQQALDRLMPVVYDELRRVARRHLRGQKTDPVLQTTVLVHEAYLRLAGVGEVASANRAQFFALSAQLMRRALVDAVRRRSTQKRGGRAVHVSLDTAVQAEAIPNVRQPDLVALDDALCELAKIDPRKARIVELRYFGGLSVEETCQALDLSRATVERDWQMARLWLSRALKGRQA